MAYVDGFLVPIPEKNLPQYKKMARKSGQIWREHGALAYLEAAADDAPIGKLTSFPRAVKLEKGETVIFAYIVYRSRAHRDAVLKKVFADPRMKPMMENMPFDTKRMIYGGFKGIVEV